MASPTIVSTASSFLLTCHIDRFWRTNGTFWTVMCHYWQMTHYPQDHYFNFSPIVQYGMWIFEACDFIIYPIVYYYVSQRERDAEKPAAGQKPKMR